MRLALLFILAFFVATQSGYAQRVYANAQQSQAVGNLLGVPLAGVDNPPFALTSSNTTHSRLWVLLAGIAKQNLWFSPASNTTINPPIMVRLQVNSAIGLLSEISLRRTNGGGLDNFNGSENYVASSLLTLLDLNQPRTVIIPPQGGANSFSNGIQITTAAVVNTGSVDIYNAFYIAPPKITGNIQMCIGASNGIIKLDSVHRFNNIPYTYRVYRSQSASDTIPITQVYKELRIQTISDTATRLWVEAREGNLYPSARVPVTITRNPLPVLNIETVPTICEGDNGTVIPYTLGTTAPNQYQITWNSGTPAGFTNVSWTNLPTTGAQIPVSVPATAPMGEYTGTLQVRNSPTAESCVRDIPFTVRIRPTPGRPHMTITDVVN